VVSCGLAALLLLALAAELSAAEPTVLSGSGTWTGTKAAGDRLSGARCRVRVDCVGFCSVDFSGPSPSIEIADLARYCAPESLESLGGVGRFGLYYDGSHVIAVDGVSLKVVWSKELSKPLQVTAHGDEQVLLCESQLLILRAGEATPEVTFEAAIKDPLELTWQPERLVLIEKNDLHWWPIVDGVLAPQGSLNAFREPLAAGMMWSLDTQGLLREANGGRRVASYAFAPDDSTRITLNSGEEIRDIADSLVVTADPTVTKLSARWGKLLRDRYVVRYWKLTPEDRTLEGQRHALVIADGDRVVLDGGVQIFRASVIDAKEQTFRRRANLDFKGPSWLLSLSGPRLVTRLSGEGEQLVIWDVDTGLVTQSFGPEALGMVIASTELLSKDRILLRDKTGRAAIFTASTGTVSALVSPTAGGTLAQAYTTLGETLIFTESQGEQVLRYHLLGSSLSERTPGGAVTEVLNPAERWYGYCVPFEACALSAPTWPEWSGSNADTADIPLVPVVTRPMLWTWVGVAVTLLLLVGVTLWRRDAGRRGVVHAQTSMQDEDETLEMKWRALVDSKGRRMLTDHNTDDFLNSTLTQVPWRLGMSMIAGGVVSIPLAFTTLLPEPLEVALPFWMSLGLPAASAVWFVMSWRMWNRLHLLRFGHCTEGQWFDSGTRKQSVCYSLPDGRTYQMKRGQWTRPDLVPIILYDANHPKLAVQYTGNGQFPVGIRREVKSLTGTANTTRMFSFLVVTVALLGVGFMGFSAFQKAFPEPISEGALRRLEGSGQKRVQLLQPCLALCKGRGESCEGICHRRQLRLILKDAGVELERDPNIDPTYFRLRQLDGLGTARAILGRSGEQCSVLAEELDALPRWTAALRLAFETTYGRLDEEANESQADFKSDELRSTEDSLRQLYKEVFTPLCLPSDACLGGDFSACGPAPDCHGENAELKRALCQFGEATR